MHLVECSIDLTLISRCQNTHRCHIKAPRKIRTLAGQYHIVGAQNVGQCFVVCTEAQYGLPGCIIFNDL
jgi:hypothetical protein